MTAIIESRPRIPRLAMIFIAAVVVMLITAPKAGAWDAKTDDGFTVSRTYKYSKWSDVTVTGYSGSSNDITLPTTVTYGSENYTVTCVGTNAFKNFKNSNVALKVTIPDTYDTIDTEAFQYCKGLSEITIPGSMKSIGYHAFDGCTGLSSVTFSEGTNPLKFGTKPFMNCTSLTALTIPARTSSITNNPIDGCTSLQTLSVESGSSNFYAQDNTLYAANEDAYSLISYAPGSTVTSITIPATVNEKPVTKIDMGAFQNNTVIQDVTIPASVTAFGFSAFDNCSALKKVSIAAENVTLSGSCFTNLAPDSVIEVANDTVKNSFESTSSYTKYYTASNTTVQVKGASAPQISSAELTAKGTGVKDGYAYYKLTLDNAENVKTMLLHLSFDASKVSKDAQVEGKKDAYVKLNDDRFSLVTVNWTEADGKVDAKILLIPKDNGEAISGTDAADLLLVGLPVKAGVTGDIAMTVSAECAGVVSTTPTNGTVTVNGSPASNRIANYDVYADSKIDILDITEAQRFYQATSTGSDWDTAQKADVNADNKVDIQDLIDIFLQIKF